MMRKEWSELFIMWGKRMTVRNQSQPLNCQIITFDRQEQNVVSDHSSLLLHWTIRLRSLLERLVRTGVGDDSSEP